MLNNSPSYYNHEGSIYDLANIYSIEIPLFIGNY